MNTRQQVSGESLERASYQSCISNVGTIDICEKIQDDHRGHDNDVQPPHHLFFELYDMGSVANGLAVFHVSQVFKSHFFILHIDGCVGG